MKLRWMLLATLLMLLRFAVAQQSVFKVLSADANSVTIRFRMSGYSLKAVKTNQRKLMQVYADDAAPLLKKGAPDLPHFAFSLLVPPGVTPQIKIRSSTYHEYHDVLVLPSKGKIYRHTNRDSIPYVFGPPYQSDKFFPENLLSLTGQYQLRHSHGQTIRLTPFQYSGATKTLRVYDEVVMQVSWPETKQAAVKQEDLLAFEKLYKNQFLNYPTQDLKQSKTAYAAERGNMLIISYGPFIPLLHDFINWKIKTGLDILVKDVAGMGSASAIKAFIKKQYPLHQLSYVLLVGDANLVPSSRLGGHDSDNDYAYVDGDDHYPDLFVGRFSAETPEQLKLMLTRSMLYEDYPVSDSAWYQTAVGIASQQGPGYKGLFDYQHIHQIDSGLLQSENYKKIFEYFDGSQGGSDAAGNPTALQIVDRLNAGVGLINYCGHGKVGTWSTSGFNNEDVKKLSNQRQWPFIFSVSCATGDFVHQTCLAEALQRAGFFGIPTGAVASLMSTMDQSWEPPMYAQQEMNNLLVNPQLAEHTFGVISMTACMRMNDLFGTDGFEITDTWTIFGDPSLEVRTRQPKNSILQTPDSLTISQKTINVSCSASTGRITLVQSNKIIASTTVGSQGNHTLRWDTTPQPGKASLTFSGMNYRPNSKTVVFYSGDTLVSDMKILHAGITRIKFYPNPFRQQLHLNFKTIRPLHLTLDLTDLNARSLFRIYQQSLESGFHQIDWALPDTDLAEGVYLLRFKTNEGVFFKRVLFQRE
jgi:gingipain R